MDERQIAESIGKTAHSMGLSRNETSLFAHCMARNLNAKLHWASWENIANAAYLAETEAEPTT